MPVDDKITISFYSPHTESTQTIQNKHTKFTWSEENANIKAIKQNIVIISNGFGDESNRSAQEKKVVEWNQNLWWTQNNNNNGH